MKKWLSNLSTVQKILLAMATVVCIFLLCLPVLAIIVMGLSAFQSDVGCKNYATEPNKTLEAQATELRAIQLLSDQNGSWTQKYIGKNCGNQTQGFRAERTIPTQGIGSTVLSELRSQLSSQGYYPTKERFTLIRKDTCEGHYLAMIDLKNGGEAVITLTGKLTPAACNKKSASLTESDFSGTSVTLLKVALSTP